MKLINYRLLFLLIGLFTFAVWSNAAASVASLELTGYDLGSCDTTTVSGVYQLIARDGGGAIVNDGVFVDAVAVYTSDAGASFNTGSYGYRSGDVHVFDIYLGPTTFSQASLYLYLTSDPSIRTPVYTLDCTTLTIYEAPTLAPWTGDTRINRNHGDLINVLYASTDSAGQGEIKIYGVDGSSQGFYIGSFTYNDVRFYLTRQNPTAVFIRKVGNSSLYALDTGEFQINIGPDAEGKTYTVIFSGMPPTNIYFR